MRARTKRRIKKRLFSPRIYALALIILASVMALGGGSSESGSANQTEQVVNSTQQSITGETIFTRICMKCHTTPEKYKSFTLYFGKAESTWEVGIRKMVSTGNVKLSTDQIKIVAKYLEETYRGG